MARPLYVLLIFVPLAIVADRLGLPGWAQFFVSLLAVIPLAGLISMATEEAAVTQGPKIGGLLNATFGNVPDLLVGYFGVRAGLLNLVRATLIGGIISNTALIIGLSFFAAGIRHGYPRFDAREAGHHTVLMLLAVSGMLLPTLATAAAGTTRGMENLSIGVAIILLIAYLAYLAFSVFGFVGGSKTSPEEGEVGKAVVSEATIIERPVARWTLWQSVLVLLIATGVLAPVTDALVSSVTPTIQALGWTDVFAGIVLVANAGNAAELYTSIVMALRGRLDLSLEVASGSSIQIATFVAPAIVLISLLFTPMTMVFSSLELAILALVVAIFSYVAHDGETNWLEGFQLIAIYVMAAAVFFVLPAA